MSPKAIMHRDKSNTSFFAIKASEHHMSGVQRMYKIWRKRVLLFNAIGIPIRTAKRNYVIDICNTCAIQKYTYTDLDPLFKYLCFM